jgi:FkbM family methyltransferase
MKILDLVQDGSLVFDVGAHAGNKTRGYLSRGARVVAFEPQPWRVAQIAALEASVLGRLTVVETAMGADCGFARLLVCDHSDTISTLDPTWPTGRFSDHRWERSIEVSVWTLDRAITTYGRPDFCKIDVEGYELEVLRGLNVALPRLSFEFVSEFQDRAEACASRINELGPYEFNLGIGERPDLHFDEWVSAAKVLAEVQTAGGGDIYARISQ